MKTVLKQAKTLPAAFYCALEALVDRNSGKAARELAEAADTQPQSYELNLTLAKLYRSRGENDKAARLLQKLADSPDTVGGRKEAVLFELGLTYQSAGLVDRAEQIFLSLENGNTAKRRARAAAQHLPAGSGLGKSRCRRAGVKPRRTDLPF